MALINCPECGKEISDQTSQCIHCGYSLTKSISPINDANGKRRITKPILIGIIAAVICVTVILIIAGINNNAAPPAPSVSAIESLNESEKEVFDKLTNNLDSFFNPSEARVLKIGNEMDITDLFHSISLQIQGTNKAGGTLNKVFSLYLWGSDEFSASFGVDLSNGLLIESEDSTIKRSWENGDVSKINNALKEYWENKGI